MIANSILTQCEYEQRFGWVGSAGLGAMSVNLYKVMEEWRDGEVYHDYAFSCVDCGGISYRYSLTEDPDKRSYEIPPAFVEIGSAIKTGYESCGECTYTYKKDVCPDCKGEHLTKQIHGTHKTGNVVKKRHVGWRGDAELTHIQFCKIAGQIQKMQPIELGNLCPIASGEILVGRWVQRTEYCRIHFRANSDEVMLNEIEFTGEAHVAQTDKNTITAITAGARLDMEGVNQDECDKKEVV